MPILANLPYIVVVVLFLIGLATIVLKRNLIKIFLGIVILESAVRLFIVSLGYREGGIAPIYTNAPGTLMVLPTPQALTLTSIVIGVATSALLLSFAIVIWKKYGSIEIGLLRRLKE
jgi:multicomponent Na+:H+ antiporter subunit C